MRPLDKVMDDFAEAIASLYKIIKLVEAFAAWRQKHRVARLRAVDSHSKRFG
jgi:hypothetical protein